MDVSESYRQTHRIRVCTNMSKPAKQLLKIFDQAVLGVFIFYFAYLPQLVAAKST